LINFQKKLKNKKVFVTGNTGFTGSWACFWLKSIGAQILGFSLPPNTSPSLFKSLNLDNEMKTIYGDICNYELLKKAIFDFKPDLILHLAAQPLVSHGYEEPLKTFNTNALGTANILEISRYVKQLKGVLCITTDKVYKNTKNQKKFVENDRIGGIDPYSASKSAAEIIIKCFAKSYFSDRKDLPIINVARGGNIIGGGDWSQNRLFPDYVRSISSKKQLDIRSYSSIRPWQHVLDLVSGYFLILTNILEGKIKNYTAWNLGPHENDSYTVKNVLEIISDNWKTPNINFIENSIKETQILTLNSNKAKEILQWNPSWNTKKAIEMTAEWYKQFYNEPREAKQISLKHLDNWRSNNF
jgi:CDP-glucose 4,6-dehydratase